MPGKRNASLKKPEMYEELREEGASKEKAARISNAAARDGTPKVGERGGESRPYTDWKVPALKRRASELGLTNYSKKNKAEPIKALRRH